MIASGLLSAEDWTRLRAPAERRCTADADGEHVRVLALCRFGWRWKCLWCGSVLTYDTVRSPALVEGVAA